ncbi:hypothetical protein MMU07_07960 [Aquiflexum sp. LQ15W]|uniref:hypothetical protein n=1 Tax=Cognataquiflexum nitidum TaxID=2922272 RepID=UPI001F1374C1|nr:hypothetical protein [Cognataquiflexum nitidum]MCH6199508.1 hypothetical protein [Cognataquiflexum nitidum]
MKNQRHNQFILKAILLTQTILLLGYTAFAVRNEGWGFLQIAVSNIGSLTWSGQFTLDFACYLLLSGIWIMWRGGFQSKSVFIAIVAMILGIVVFAPYMVYLLVQEKGDLKKVLLGEHMA